MSTTEAPATLRNDAADLVHGVRFADPYRWLEAESPESQAWERDRSAAAKAYLDALPGIDTLERAVTQRMTEGLVFTPKLAGGLWFALRLDPDVGGAVLSVSARLGEPGRAIARPGEIARDAAAGFDWFHPSPDGTLVAVGVSLDGDEQSTLHVLDVATGVAQVDPVPFVVGGRVSWLPDSSGLYYYGGVARATENAVGRIFSWTVGAPRPREAAAFESTERSFSPHVSACGRYVAVTGSFICPRLMHLLDRETGVWTDVFPQAQDERFSGTFVGDRYVAVTTIGADRGRLVSAPLDQLENPDAWDELVPEGEGILRTVSRAGDRLVLASYVDGVTRLTVTSLDGTAPEEIALPGRGVAAPWGLFPFQVGGDAPVEAHPECVTFVYSSVNTRPAVYHYDLEARKLSRVGPELPVSLDVDVEHRTCTSADGETVRYTVIARAGTDLSAPRPTVIHAYGGWGIMFLAEIYLGIMTPVVEAGGVVVIAHLRGDATFGGKAQWLGGKLHNKQRSFEDFFAVAEDLVARGTTVPEQLALFGSSNGGLLGGAIVTQRPELLKALVLAVPLLDMCRFPVEHFSELFIEEYGNPLDVGDTQMMRDYSPYHNVQEGQFPAMLLVAGGSDVRCQPWHARKMAAAVEQAQTGDAPVLLRVHPNQGHAVTVAGPPRVVAEWLGFLMDQIGLGLDGIAVGTDG